MAAAGFLDRWQTYRASKTMVFWSCAACVIATMVVGFMWGGWVTGGTADKMAAAAASSARAELAATMCVSRFMSGADLPQQLAALKASNSWNRNDLIDKAGWTTPPGVDSAVQGAADLCVKRLLETKAAG